MTELLKCPCGNTPTRLRVVENGQGYKYANAVPSCCGEWTIEFRTVNYELDTDATMKAAIKAWNEATRG